MPAAEPSLVQPSADAPKQQLLAHSHQHDPRIEHPTAGKSTTAKLKADARDSALRAIIIALGRDRILGMIASADGMDRALYVAEMLGLNADDFREASAARRQQIGQASRVISGGWSLDHSELVVRKIMQGRPMAEIQAARAEARQEAAEAAAARAKRDAQLSGQPVTPLIQQHTAVHEAESFENDPRHDERVMELLLSGAPLARVGEMIREVSAEYAERAQQPASNKISAPPMMASAPSAGSTQ